MNRKLSPVWTLFILTGLNLFNYLDRNVVPAVLTDIKRQFLLAGWGRPLTKAWAGAGCAFPGGGAGRRVGP